MERSGRIELRVGGLQEPLCIVQRIRGHSGLVLGCARVLSGQTPPRLGECNLRRDDQRPGQFRMVWHFRLTQRSHGTVDQVPGAVEVAVVQSDSRQRHEGLGPDASRFLVRLDPLGRCGSRFPILGRAGASLLFRDDGKRGPHGGFGRVVGSLQIGRGTHPLAGRLPLSFGGCLVGRLLGSIVELPSGSGFQIVFRDGGIGVERQRPGQLAGLQIPHADVPTGPRLRHHQPRLRRAA